MKRIVMTEVIERIEEMVGIDNDTREFYPAEKSRFFFLSGENQSGIEEKYMIYDCHEQDYKFELENYDNMMKDEDEIATPIIVFKDWEHERELFWEVYDSVKTAKEKKALNDYFTKKISLYTDLGESITLQVGEDGINYLEYKPEVSGVKFNKGLKGYIYNISIFELKKLFNITGTSLFKMNVRNGLRKNATGRELKRKFRNYLCVGIYSKLEKLKTFSDDDKKQRLKEILEICDEDVLKNSIPQNFWFYHNGITIFAYDTDIDRSGSYIKINPLSVSVINGAQTLTNFFTEWDDLKHDLSEKLQEFNVTDKKDIEQKLEEVCKAIIIKVILIDGELTNVRSITNGLNTQIPIFNEDIIADQENVKEINKHILKRGMKILKSGEETYYGEGMNVIDFTKKFLMTKNEPGTSKNLKKSAVEGLLQEALNCFENEEQEGDLLKQFELLIELEEWWKLSKRERIDTYKENEEKTINNYGKNYFFCYVLNEYEGELDSEYTFVLFNQFIVTFKSLKDDIEIEDFKKNELFDDYLECKKREDSTRDKKNVLNGDISSRYELTEDDVDMMMDYLNENGASKYAYVKAVSDYLEFLGKEVEYFRIIKRYKGVEKFVPKEAFPFPASTFSELYRTFENENENKTREQGYLPYEKSVFFNEICRHYPVFVIDFEKNEEGMGSKIEKIKYIKDFSFERFTTDAKIVYDKTVEAFEIGDESMFPKISSGNGFHVRPKGINADDTFEFTNGAQITKRTFWANRETVNALIEEITDNR